MKHDSYRLTHRIFEIEDKSTFDTPAFKIYQKKIEKLMSATPITIGRIHRELMGEAIPKWTMDSLELSEKCERVPGALLDKWKRRAKQNFAQIKQMAPMGITPLPYEKED